MNPNWTPEECMRLLRSYKAQGPAWKNISLSFSNRGTRAIKNQFFSVLRNYIQKLFRAGCTSFKANEIHRIKPRVLANFLEYVFENSDCSIPKMDQPRCSVFDLIERLQANEWSERPNESLLQTMNLNFEKGLMDLRNGK